MIIGGLGVCVAALTDCFGYRWRQTQEAVLIKHNTLIKFKDNKSTPSLCAWVINSYKKFL